MLPLMHYGRVVTPPRQVVYQRFYKIFIEGIDGIDNGVQQYPADIAPAYVENTHLGARVGRLNPGWNAEVRRTLMAPYPGGAVP